MRSRELDAIEEFLEFPDWEKVKRVREVVAQTRLQTLFDVVQRAINSDYEVLLYALGGPLEPGSREPRWDVPHCKSRSAKETTPFLSHVQIGNVLTRKPGAVTSSIMVNALSAEVKKGHHAT